MINRDLLETGQNRPTKRKKAGRQTDKQRSGGKEPRRTRGALACRHLGGGKPRRRPRINPTQAHALDRCQGGSAGRGPNPAVCSPPFLLSRPRPILLFCRLFFCSLSFPPHAFSLLFPVCYSSSYLTSHALSHRLACVSSWFPRGLKPLSSVYFYKINLFKREPERAECAARRESLFSSNPVVSGDVAHSAGTAASGTRRLPPTCSPVSEALKLGPSVE